MPKKSDKVIPSLPARSVLKKSPRIENAPTLLQSPEMARPRISTKKIPKKYRKNPNSGIPECTPPKYPENTKNIPKIPKMPVWGILGVFLSNIEVNLDDDNDRRGEPKIPERE